MKIRQQGKGLLDVTYFNFSRFIESYFKKIQPQQLARDKLVFNFLWSIHHSNNNVLVEVIIDLIKGNLVLRDLLNLLMVKDFVKQNLKKTAQLNHVDLANVGQSYQTLDDLVELTRSIVLNYEDSFKAFYEEKFLQLKGDLEYMNLLDFMGIATRAFSILRKEGIEPKLKKVKLFPVGRPAQFYTDGGHTIDNHMLRCFGKIPIENGSGYIQDRSKAGKDVASPIKWHLWSDYPQNQDRV